MSPTNVENILKLVSPRKIKCPIKVHQNQTRMNTEVFPKQYSNYFNKIFQNLINDV